MLSSKSLGRMCLQANFGPKSIKPRFVPADAINVAMHIQNVSECGFSLPQAKSCEASLHLTSASKKHEFSLSMSQQSIQYSVG